MKATLGYDAQRRRALRTVAPEHLFLRYQQINTDSSKLNRSNPPFPAPNEP